MFETKVCSKCKTKKYLECFYTRKSYSGRSRLPESWCKECNAKKAQKYNKAHPEKRNVLTKQYQNRCRLLALKHYSKDKIRCACCGLRDEQYLVLDHINGGGNKHRKENKISYLPVWLRARGFPDGFQVLCHNCNFAKSLGGCHHITGRHSAMADVHGYADIHPSAEFGEGSKVWNFTVIGSRVKIGKNCVIGSNCYIGDGTIIEDYCRIQTSVFITKNTRIGKNCFIGPGVVFTDDKYPQVNNHDYDARPPSIHDFVSIGAGAVILPGVEIWEGAMIGAGAIVAHDVPPNTVNRELSSSVNTGPYEPTEEELKGNNYSYCYGQPVILSAQQKEGDNERHHK